MNTIYYACKDLNNWGDLLSKWLCEKVTGREFTFSEDRELIVSGSVLKEARENTIVMGAGFGSLFQTTEAREIHFVRGYLSAAIAGHAPFVFEPAFCLREFFADELQPDIEVGYLPHYIDRPESHESYPENWYYIDICGGIEQVVLDLKRCKTIITSSLHGMVLADLFERPNVLVSISDNIDTDGFKYCDYWTFQGTKPYIPVNVNSEKIYDKLSQPVIKFDKGIMAKTFLRELEQICQ